MGQDLFGTHLDEEFGAHGVQFAYAFDPAHGRGDLLGQAINVGCAGLRVCVVGQSVQVGQHGDARAAEIEAIQYPPQGLFGQGHNGAVEGMGDVQHDRLDSGGGESGHGRIHGGAGPGQDGLAGRVEVGRHYSLDVLDPAHEFVGRHEDRGHFARIVHAYADHLFGPGADSQ